MEIKIEIEDNTIQVDNTGINNDNYVNLTIGETTEMAPLTELYLAVKAFYDLRIANMERDEFYKKQDN